VRLTAGALRDAYERALRRLADPSLAPQGGSGPRLGARLGPIPEPLLPLLPSQPVAAAVLVGFVEREDPGILLTVRATNLRQHAGQISFPGGRIEADDASPAAAAVREAQEEIGVDPAGVRVIGQLPDQIVLTGYRITPVVARIEGVFEPRLDPGEVQELFELPLSRLLDSSHHETYRRSIGGTELEMRDIRFGRHRIWGATAGILLTLREYALE
jgi:8-oxo-dGTP pyrophosphatase MutT (NUDIX family)